MLRQLYILPGNPGTAKLGENVDGISTDDHQAIRRFCSEKHIDLVIIGPENFPGCGFDGCIDKCRDKSFRTIQGCGTNRIIQGFFKEFL